MSLIEPAAGGLYCAAGDFYIDPLEPAPRAVITHAHSDHARPGCGSYLAAEPGLGLLRERLGPEASIEAVPYGKKVRIGGVNVSLHPAGHILGSAQVRIEHRGEVWVVSGDYKRDPDPTCAPLEPLRCHVFISESTYGLPIYRWRPPEEVLGEIRAWWQANQQSGRTSILFAHALGKAQRVLAALGSGPGPIVVHGAVARYLPAYAAAGVKLPPLADQVKNRGLVIAPPSARGSPWLRRFGASSTGAVSGGMQIRGLRRRQGVDRGFVLSDHADWDALLAAIRESGA